jgi:hypothetical protein
MCVERAEGRADISYGTMAEIILEELGIKFRPCTIRNHVASCLQDLHRQIQARGRRA